MSKLVAVCPPGFTDNSKQVIITFDGVLVNETSDQDIKNQVVALVDDEVKQQIVTVIVETEDQVHVSNVVVVVEGGEAADAVAVAVQEEAKKDDCASGVLCRVASVRTCGLNSAVRAAALVPLLFVVFVQVFRQQW